MGAAPHLPPMTLPPLTHLVLGHANDAHARHMLEQLRLRGPAHLLQTDQFPAAVRVSLRPGSGGTLHLADGVTLDFDQIGAVYWRNFCGVSMETSKLGRGSMQDIAYHDSMACLRSWFAHHNGTRWFNSWAAFQSHQEKPHQLALVAAAGVRIPPTYIGNDAAQVRAFCQAEPQAMFKPVYGGAHAEMITERHLAPERLAASLRQAPITLQRFIGGTNIRTYAIGTRRFSIELPSAEVDFRLDAGVRPVAVDLPDAVQDQVGAIMACLGLNWTAIDWRRDPSGAYYFLEANPSPMFLGAEQATGLPLCATLVEAMTA